MVCSVVWCGVVCCETHSRVLLELFDLLCRAGLELTPELDKLHVLHMHKGAAGQTDTHALSRRLGCYNLKRVNKNQWQSYTQAGQRTIDYVGVKPLSPPLHFTTSLAMSHLATLPHLVQKLVDDVPQPLIGQLQVQGVLSTCTCTRT